ncbi:uncharacterized protein BJ212DRAFT_1483786 [Suillus subaureus]|uniref:Uncharacterized protein n=1 Tax=Suillus subaureus TaxID=48587 RepID=A0A9P7JAE6_9AGAM|nr:uncharacterized protein BJ212DRAFT_1483786 [Suillus subaureus]KAG1811113.1 hypothetical protein BJ212DRAFT_1483786 [Suillus subaureus]
MGNYDRAIEIYSAAIDLNLATDTIFANRSKARSGKMLWDNALLDAEKVIELDPSSYFGHQLKHAALHGAHQYDEAIEAFEIMLSKLENASDTQTQSLRQQYVSPSEAEGAIQETIKAQLDDIPHHLINTSTGLLCNHEAQINTFSLKGANNVEVQQSVNSMFIWYHHSTLTIIYLLDVPPLSKPRALTSSAWNMRGWTVQEFLAPNFVLFYQRDWSLYLDNRSPNHKDSLIIMQEMADVVGIDTQALITFRPGMRFAQEKLQWVLACVTTCQEDIAYSLFGIFGINLPAIYGEKKKSALDWVGQLSEFNSCLPANIASYKAPPYTMSSLSEDDIQASISSLRHEVAADVVLKLYTLLDNLSTPRFRNCRLHLPCIAFCVTAVKWNRAQDQEIYETFLLVRPWNRHLLELPDFMELSGLAELPEIAGDRESEEGCWSAPGSPSQQSSGSFLEAQESVDSELSSRALQLATHLRQPFGAFLLAQQRSREYKRIASDHDIFAQVKDLSSISDMVKTLEIS